MSKIIEIVVSPTGEPRVETKGFAGAECLEASRFVEEALGQKSTDEKTAEFHSTESVREVRTQAE